jgi:HEAT repeat protein
VQRLSTRDPHISVPATWALQQAGPSAIPALLTGLQDPHTRVRRGCVDIIDHGGYGADARCVAALLLLLRDPIPHIRRAVWHTLFCERCQDAAKCEVTPTAPLDQVALLIEIGLNDPNPKLRGQLIDQLREQQADARAQFVLKQLETV